MSALLRIEDLRVSYGAVEALRGVDLEVRPGEATGVLGANGAGKSTLVRTVMGLVAARGGRVAGPDGASLLGARPYRIARAGLAIVPEGGGLFRPLSVEDNLRVGPASLGVATREIEQRMRDVYARFPRLEERRAQQASTLSGGERQMLGLGRALMVAPRVLLLDEPSLGLAPLIVRQIMEQIAHLAKEGMAILLVEQNAREALAICGDAIVLERGTVRLRGRASDLIDDPAVAAAYLGGHVGANA